MNIDSRQDLRNLYESRFRGSLAYRRAVWQVLISDFFLKFLTPEDTVLDLGCGYGEFINQVSCRRRFAIDLNPASAEHLNSQVTLFEQDCSTAWPLPEATLDVVFTSNFLEHLPDKTALARTIDEARRCLKAGGLLIALGPNIRYLPGRYWDFWDHHVPLTDRSLSELLQSRGFTVSLSIGKFLPYTMSQGRQYPVLLLRLYLRLRPVWRIFGRQFLVIAKAR